MELDNEQLKDISVSVVEGFINHKVPLNEGIAKQASEMELNSDQIKRVVEASNTIAYLRLQKEAEDKTFEFPVGDYEGVMKTMVLPSGEVEPRGQTKIAGVLDETNFFEPTIDPEQQRSWLRTSMLNNHYQLEKIAVEKEGLAYAILDAARALSKDEYALEKLAEVCEEDVYARLSSLLTKEADYKLRERVFRDGDLNVARELVDIYKQATELLEEEKERQGLDKRAFTGVKNELKHMAQNVGAGKLGSAANNAAGAAATALGHTVGGVVGAAGGLGVRTAQGLRAGGRALGFGKDKIGTLGKGLMAATHDVAPDKNVWDNLQGSMKRF